MFRIFAFTVLVGLLGACHSNQLDPNAQKPANGTTATTPSAATNTATAPTAGTQDSRGEVMAVLNNCTKVEYMVYDAGITFESESNAEVLRFFSYVSSNPPSAGCPVDKYDGNAVFKNAQGEIKMQLQFNLPALSNCNRIMFTVNGTRYDLSLDANGLQFFGQVLNMRNQVGH
jgi:hypothetical protein